MAQNNKKKLVIFDIDGTLMHSAGHDESMFKKAHAVHLGTEITEAHWGNFTHMTDHAINTEFFERVHDRPATAVEVGKIKVTFLKMVIDAHQTAPEKFSPVKGSIQALNRLIADENWTICFASGGWGVSSSFKLSTLGITAHEYPAAFGDIHLDRLSLVESAIKTAQYHANVTEFEKIVSIGDAVWDVETAKKLDLAFVGVASWVKPEDLHRVGASHVIEHFEDFDHFEECLNKAEVPG